MTALNQQLRELNDGARGRIPADTLAVMDKATRSLELSGIARDAVAVGTPAPAFSLPDQQGQSRTLEELRREGPVVISFYRGAWCPYCNLELRALQATVPEMAAIGARLVAISPQTPDNSLSTAEKHELGFPVLSDVSNHIARAYGLVFALPEDLRSVYATFGIDVVAANGDETFELPLPATFVIDDAGVIRWRFVDPDYTRRADPQGVLAALRAL